MELGLIFMIPTQTELSSSEVETIFSNLLQFFTNVQINRLKNLKKKKKGIDLLAPLGNSELAAVKGP
jgi:hypothetical protein